MSVLDANIVAAEPMAPERKAVRQVLRSLWSDKSAVLGAVYLVLLVLAAVFGPLLVSTSATHIDILNRLSPPAWEEGGSSAHLLGTDLLGRDMLARLLAGARISLLIGVSVVVIAGTVGTVLGIVAGYKGGRWDTVIMRLADAQLAFPGLLLVLLVLAVFGSSILTIIGVLSAYGWMIYARLVRGMVLQIRPTPAIQAAVMVGCSTPRILLKHVLPVLYTTLLTQAMLELPRVMIAEASLSFLGLGVQPPLTSWGLMVAENRSRIADAWWTVLLPGLILTLTVLALNLVANWLRRQSNPRLHRRGRRRRPDAPAPAVASRTRVTEIGAAVSAAPEPLLAADDLWVRYGTDAGEIIAVAGASLRIAPGEALAIVGESGSGKSSLALALMDLVVPPGRTEAGSLRWRGEEIGLRGLRARRGAEITMVFQDPMTSLNPLVPVGRQVAEVLVKHRGMRMSDALDRTVELFELVGIASPGRRLRQFPYQLSGGLRQRVMIATAIAPEPALLIADEPTTALDATIQAQILELIAELRQRLGLSLVLITHDLGVVARVADNVAVMYGGRVVERAPVRPLLSQPRHRYTQALLTSIPRVETTGRDLPVIPGRPPSGLEALSGCPFKPRCAFAGDDCQVMPTFQRRGESTFACRHPVGLDTGAVGVGQKA
jgi:peptide/nickel transport system permease protein